MDNILFLVDFSPIKPDFGLILWTSVIFLIFWFMMSRLAFGPIRDALKKREGDIQDAIDEAKLARQEMANLQSENDKLLQQAREERAKMLAEAKETKDSIIKEAKESAKGEAQKIINSAQQEIENQKNAAMAEVKENASNIALQIAEKVIRKELVGNPEQEAFANSLVNDIKLN